ncbi:MAG: cyclic nucleotide-binding protein [Acidobacteria bacterium]|nr:cyclic nucleotide-binding protein [Acidobacteriota bacterium]
MAKRAPTGGWSPSSATDRPTPNRLLTSLTPAAYARLAKHLIRVTLQPRQVVYKPQQPIDHVLFPDNCVLCLITLMENGDSIEAGTVGREGASWISASVGAPSMPCETVVAIEGTALRLGVDDLDREMKENRHFRDVLTGYSHALLIASMRTSACNGLHELPQRCARWILTTLDRIDVERFSVTQDFLAQLLGTSRPTVSLMLATLERAGLVTTTRGAVTVVDRVKLKDVSCECYAIIKQNYDAIGRAPVK